MKRIRGARDRKGLWQTYISMGEELGDFLRTNTLMIDARMEGFLAEKKVQVEKAGVPELVRELYGFVINQLESYVSGGKKIRGNMVMLGYEIAGGASKDVLGVAVGVELVHSFLLIQDDIMDEDVLRRGKPTLHEAVREWAEAKGMRGPGHYGQSVAMTVSDLLQFWGSELFFETNLDREQMTRAWRYWTGVLEQTAWGQLQDISYESVGELSESEILAMQEWKTGVYTMSGPMSLGLILGKGSSEVQEAIERYGKQVGVAFQLMDDDLGLFGHSGTTGKGNGGDVKLNKHTLLKKKLFERVSEDERVRLSEIYGNRAASEEEMNWVKELSESTGTRQYAKDLAGDFCARAKTEVASITGDVRLGSILEQMADYVINRDK